MSLSSNETHSTLQTIEKIVLGAGFDRFGIAELTKPLSIEFYENWLQNGYHGEMSYLERHLPDKKEPQRLLKKARSAIVVTKNYVPHPASLDPFPIGASLGVAAYAKGRDYHHFLASQLKMLITELRVLFPNEEFVSFTDSGPVLERDLAHRAGLGWVGKNTCLIDRSHGSLFFIAEIYSTVSLPTAKTLSTDFCGTCTRCLDACPTGALKEPRKLDARLCISYLTIESRQTPPLELRAKIGNWFFGCDICQTVCPWNKKVFGKETLDQLAPQTSKEELIEDLRFILRSGNRALERAFQGTPLLRSGGIGLKRNALIVAGNRGASELKNEISEFLNHPKLGEIALWALAQIDSSTNALQAAHRAAHQS